MSLASLSMELHCDASFSLTRQQLGGAAVLVSLCSFILPLKSIRQLRDKNKTAHSLANGCFAAILPLPVWRGVESPCFCTLFGLVLTIAKHRYIFLLTLFLTKAIFYPTSLISGF